jgi:hypothetical protein
MELSGRFSLSEFFREVLSDAIRRQGVAASPPAESYLVNLLAGFATAPPDDEPLALKLAAATDSTPDERATKLKEIGDTSLYVSGFFAESIERKLLDVTYYVQMGGTAYAELSRFYRGYRHSSAFGDLFAELGTNFPAFVDVLGEIHERTSGHSQSAVLSLYERWLKTGSAWMERRLRELGVLPRLKEVH